jgi:hypothetical protein
MKNQIVAGLGVCVAVLGIWIPVVIYQFMPIESIGMAGIYSSMVTAIVGGVMFFSNYPTE